MDSFFKVFSEENWLHLADHIVTILFGVASFILAIRLTRKDKAKTIAINELKSQTKKLEELYLYQIQPKFVANRHSSGYIYIKNIGGDCYNLKISPVEDLAKRGNPFESWENFRLNYLQFISYQYF